MNLRNAFLSTVLSALAVPQLDVGADDVAVLEERALNAAVDAVADAVVQITTVGGLDRLDDRALAQGPTTGLVVRADGYIVSSAFNFAQAPTSILVRLPNGEQRPAELIGRDANRMLVLLKVSVDSPLVVPTPAPVKEVRPGDWAVAVGRTYRSERVNISVGVVSALNRMHGRALQTDANVSASNYGGPLVDIQGRVMGILVPMAPPTGSGDEADVMAGSEFYDSGIGFAVPLTHVMNVLDRWIKDGDLKRGLLGVGLKQGAVFATPAEITAVWPGSPAATAGFKANDRIVSVDGRAIESQNDLRFQVSPRYAGDELEVTIRRGKGKAAKEISSRLTLSDKLPVFQHAFLGILPERESSALDVKEDVDSEAAAAEASEREAANGNGSEATLAIRGIWPDSPAERAGLQAGDHVTTFDEKPVTSWTDLLEKLNAHSPGEKVLIGINRAKEELTLEVELGELPVDILPSSFHSGGEESGNEGAKADKKDSLELDEFKVPEMPQTARYLRPAKDGPAPGLLVWLGESGEEAAQTMAGQWAQISERDRLIILLPKPADAAGWSSDDQEYLTRLMQTAVGRLEVDRRRIVIAGQGKAGQLAYAMAFANRREVDGVIAVDSPLPRTLELPDTRPNERLAVLSVESPDTPLSQLMREDRRKLDEKGYPATQVGRRGADAEKSPLTSATRAKVARWIDGLDRI